MDLIIVVIVIAMAIILALGIKVAIIFAAKKGFDSLNKKEKK